jgi:hypothetical protein
VSAAVDSMKRFWMPPDSAQDSILRMQQNRLADRYLMPDDVQNLNFIRKNSPYAFRRHNAPGLRSHIMYLLDAGEAHKEKKGVAQDGVRIYPKAVPKKILRIFKRRFQKLNQALDEINRYKVMEKYFCPDYIAKSNEFIVDLTNFHDREIILCGIQDYVEGNVLDPWGIIHWHKNSDTFVNIVRGHDDPDCFFQTIKHHAAEFIRAVKKMIHETSRVPDLAGIGNIRLSADGKLRLVDINNISDIVFEPDVYIDDKNFPVCDKSIEAMALLEEKMLGQPPDMSEPIYQAFLNPERKNKINRLITSVGHPTY